MAKTTWIPPRFKNQLHCGIVEGGWGWSQVSQPGLDLITVAPTVTAKAKTSRKTKNLTAKTKYLTAKPKTSRQKQKPHCKNKIPHDKTKDLTAKPKSERPHGKTKYFTAKTKYLAAKANTHCKTKVILLLPWSIWFCREVFCYCREVFFFAVKTLKTFRKLPTLLQS